MKWKRACGRGALASLAAVLLLTDRLTKAWALSRLGEGGTARGVGGLFDFRFTFNEGAAFSMLASNPAVVALLSAALLVALGAVILWGRTLSLSLRLGLTAVWAGGVGNLLDRLMYGAVVDFIELRFLSFPIFNFADICVTLGAVWLAVRVLFTEKKEGGKP